MIRYKYPCTGHIEINGFGRFLEQNMGSSRKNIKIFTEELKSKLCAKYISLTNSGSSANLIALTSLKKHLADGDEVLISGFTFPTTVSAVLFNNLTPIAVDTEKHGFNIDETLIEKAITEKTKVLLVTHFLGFIANMDKIAEIANKYNLYLVQDCCETFDAHPKGRKLSEYGDVCTFSFYHPHHLSSYGGGAITCNSLKLYEHIESMIHWGRKCKCHYSSHCEAPKGIRHNFFYTNLGFNLEISELNAAFGLYRLQRWDEMEKRRRENYRRYYEALAKYPFFDIKKWDKEQCSPFVFPIIVKSAAPFKISEIINYLLGKSIEVRNLMGGSVVSQPAFNGRVKYSNLKNCIWTSRNSFFLGIHQTIPNGQIAFIIKTIKTFLKEKIR